MPKVAKKKASKFKKSTRGSAKSGLADAISQALQNNGAFNPVGSNQPLFPAGPATSAADPTPPVADPAPPAADLADPAADPADPATPEPGSNSEDSSEYPSYLSKLPEHDQVIGMQYELLKGSEVSLLTYSELSF
ncbi:hypothetical protein H0H87_012933 [Tephrocybe sp. NHM501043]|nr:hypothetical protein H0H87_012933 [Tephrocybe sp. NHM501043]